jgi:hypothetical protein
MYQSICVNCGGSKFSKSLEKYTCEYCGSEFDLSDDKLNKENQDTKVQGYQTTSRKKKLPKWQFLIGVPFICLGWFILYSASFYNSSNSISNNTDNYAHAMEHIEEVGDGWTQELYESIQVATKNYSGDSSRVTYSDGTLYDELSKQISNPKSTDSYTYDDATTITVDWSSPYEMDCTVFITIEYDEETNMVTRKFIDVLSEVSY